MKKKNNAKELLKMLKEISFMKGINKIPSKEEIRKINDRIDRINKDFLNERINSIKFTIHRKYYEGLENEDLLITSIYIDDDDMEEVFYLLYLDIELKENIESDVTCIFNDQIKEIKNF